jgi:hypothetical protein
MHMHDLKAAAAAAGTRRGAGALVKKKVYWPDDEKVYWPDDEKVYWPDDEKVYWHVGEGGVAARAIAQGMWHGAASSVSGCVEGRCNRRE